jgi:adenine-specific DNA-methyltransferase
MTSNKKSLGQYFTQSEYLQLYVFEKVKHKSACLLEPSFGAGHLLKKFKAYNANYPMVCFEIDSSIKTDIMWNSNQTIIYSDFTKYTFTQKFKTIIGNPPYVKQSTNNLYLQFIELCYNLLDDTDGEMIFIVPSDFLKLTSAASLIETMTTNGHFSDFFFPHDETLFTDARVDVVVFRYEKGRTDPKTIVNGKEMFCNVQKGIITFSETASLFNGKLMNDIFDAYVGLVSGRDAIYNVPFGNIDLLTDKDRIEKYIFIESFPDANVEINTHLLAHKSDLIERKIRKFNESNWFEWGAPRNLAQIRRHWGQPCIYVRTMTRNKIVAFQGTVQYFGGTLLCLIPKIADIDLNAYIEFLNSTAFQTNYIYSGRFKIGQKQLANAIIPTSITP